MNSLETYQHFLIEKKAVRESLFKQVETTSEKIESLETKSELHTKARWVLAEVARLTQEQFIQQVESLVTSALRSVFPNRDFRFVCQFEIKRNKSECFLRIVEGDGEPFEPKDEMGGGLVDTISLALRIVFWSLQNPRTRPVLILDEPIKNADRFGMREQLGIFLKEISEKLKCQIIMVTHEPELMEIADRSWLASHDGTKVHLEQQYTSNENEEGEKVMITDERERNTSRKKTSSRLRRRKETA